MGEQPSAPARVRVASAAVVFFSCLLLVIAAEALLRLRQRDRHGFTQIDELLQIDPNDPENRHLIPGAVVGAMHINSRGFRSPEVIVPKPADSLRLAFLGASTTFCAEVSADDKTWPHHVWRTISATRSADYVNAAAPGLRLKHIQSVVDRELPELSPDVIVFYEATNELSYDTKILAREQGLYQDSSQLFDWLVRSSLFFELAEKNLQVMMRASDAQITTNKLKFEPRELSKGFEERLRRFVAAAQKQAKVVALVTFASRVRRGMSPEELKAAVITASYYMPYMSTDGFIAGFEEYNRVIRQVAADTHCVLIEAENKIPPDPKYYTDSVHFTDAGAELMGEIVASGLLAAPEFRALMTSR